MRISLQALLILFVAALLTGCESTGVLDANESSTEKLSVQRSDDNGDGTIPFSAVIDNTAEIVLPPPPPVINAIFRGTMQSHPFGPSEFFATSQIDPFVLPNHQTAEGVFTYRNGDELQFSSVGIGIPDEFGNSDFSGDYTITGGTGRFEEATGSGTYAGRFDGATSSAHWTMEGVISGVGDDDDDN